MVEAKNESDKSFEPALEKIVLIQAEVVTKFMQVGGVDFFAIEFRVTFRKVPEVFQKQKDLRRHG